MDILPKQQWYDSLSLSLFIISFKINANDQLKELKKKLIQ